MIETFVTKAPTPIPGYGSEQTCQMKSSIIAELPNGEVEHCKGTEKQMTEPNEMMAGVSLIPRPSPSFSSLAVRTASDEKLDVRLGTRL